MELYRWLRKNILGSLDLLYTFDIHNLALGHVNWSLLATVPCTIESSGFHTFVNVDETCFAFFHKWMTLQWWFVEIVKIGHVLLKIFFK